ncbi:hypothetical protein BDR03DRAFT_974236 [Suillus americanus]|nr:hypothetical protein BDR03DRAFT_974236 [Suillus americanus]
MHFSFLVVVVTLTASMSVCACGTGACSTDKDCCETMVCAPARLSLEVPDAFENQAGSPSGTSRQSVMFLLSLWYHD